MPGRRSLWAGLSLGVGLLAGCTAGAEHDARPSRSSTALEPRASATTTPAAPRSPSASQAPGSAKPAEPAIEVSDGRPQRALLSIAALGLRDLLVVPYRGRTDDARGTEIQNAGHLASPHGPHGGVGPGGVGNFQVTGHRLSSTHPFRYLPSLERGARVQVEAGGVRYTYRIVETRRTSFRSARSLAEQRAAVPGHPGREPTQAMVTLSTCATIEDHAAGNSWADRFGNPEHRFDKVGVLVASGPA